MKHPLRSVVRMGAALALLVSAAACSSNGGSTGQPGTVTLKLASFSTYKPGLDQQIADFEKANPNVKITAAYYPSDQYALVIPTQFSAGNGSDIFFALGGVAQPDSVGPFAKAGYFADLSSQSWVSTMFGPTKSLYQYEGKVVARDLGMSTLAAYSYNKDFFAQHNLTVPKTFADVLSLCQKIAATGTVPVGWGAATPGVNINGLVSFAGDTVLVPDPQWMDQRLAHQNTFATTPGWTQAVDQLVQMKNAKCFSPGAAGVAITQMDQQFASGTTAMMFTYGGQNGLVLAQTPNLQVGMFAPPGVTEDQSRITVQSAGGLGIWSKSTHIAEAEKFLDFISDPAESAKFADANKLISPSQGTNGTLPPLYAELNSYFTGNKVITDITARWPNTKFSASAGASIQGLFTGQKTPEQIIKDLDQFFDATS